MSTNKMHALVLALGVATSTSAHAQCLEWSQGFGWPGTDAPVFSTATLDDGSGPALYIGGVFTKVGTVSASCVAKWDGESWSSLGSGTDGGVLAFAVYDDGAGPALYAAGSFSTAGGGSASNIAKWDGASWSALASGIPSGFVRAMAVHDDGTGPALYAAGFFPAAGGGSAGIARWNGASWSAVGTGTIETVNALAVWDDGSGPALYAGGNFSSVGGEVAENIAKWSGGAWSPVGATSLDVVLALCVHDDQQGGGPRLFAGGGAASAPGYVKRWNGFNWQNCGPSFCDPGTKVRALTVYDNGQGGGPKLVAGGNFTGLCPGGSGLLQVAAWNGVHWSALGSGVGESIVNNQVEALAAYDDGSGSKLFSGGWFSRGGDKLVAHLTAWDGTQWQSTVMERGLPFQGRVIQRVENGLSGEPEIYVAARDLVVRLDDTHWTLIGSRFAGVAAIEVFDEGAGPAVYVGYSPAATTFYNQPYRWNGANWATVGGPLNGVNGAVTAMAKFDDGAGLALFVGGSFMGAAGGSVPTSNVARWSGSTWSALGLGVNGAVNVMTTFDDGTGDALFVAGTFTTAGGIPASRIARWDGTSWSALGSGVDSNVLTLAVHDDGSGPALYAGGDFTQAGGVAANRVARWDGSTWSAVGSGANLSVRSLASHPDGGGFAPALYAGGFFTDLGGPANYIARWDGASWSSLGSGMNVGVRGVASIHDPMTSGPHLIAIGDFTTAGGTASNYAAKWLGCGVPGNAYCFGDGIDPVVTAQCPCGNFGDAGHGCANSNALLGGARLWASGSTSPNTLVLHCEGIPNNALGTFMRGTMNTAAGLVMGDGVQCATGTIIRFGQQAAGQNGNPSNTIAVGAATVVPGLTRYYQVQYRNPNAGFCPPEIFSFSNGYVVSW